MLQIDQLDEPRLRVQQLELRSKIARLEAASRMIDTELKARNR